MKIKTAKSFFIIALGLTLGLSNASYASGFGTGDSPNDGCSLCALTQAINATTNAVIGASKAFTHTLIQYMTSPGKDTPKTIVYDQRLANIKNPLPNILNNNSPQQALIPDITQSSTSLSNTTKTFKAPMNYPTLLTRLVNMHDPMRYAEAFGGLCAGDFPYPENKACRNKANPSNTSPGIYDASSLLGAETYNSLESRNALDYIGFVSGIADPYQVLDKSDWDVLARPDRDGNNLLGKPGIMEYRSNVRSYIALQSLGLNNLLYLYAQHTPISKLGNGIKASSVPNLTQQENGKPVGTPNNDNAILSKSAYNRFIATRHLGDAQWYGDIATAHPATVERSTLYTLAEIEYELNQRNQMEERMLATDAATEIELSLGLRSNLQNEREGVVATADTTKKNNIKQTTKESTGG